MNTVTSYIIAKFVCPARGFSRTAHVGAQFIAPVGVGRDQSRPYGFLLCLLLAVFAFARPEFAHAADIEAKLGDTAGADKFVVNDSAGAAKFAVLSDGKVGIGTAAPGYKLDVKGDAAFGSGTTRSLVIPAIPTLTGANNTIVGVGAGEELSSGTQNTVLGAFALDGSATANNNTVVGYGTLAANTTGSNNIVLGYRAGDNITTGTNNIIIGYDIDAPSATGSNQMSIGNLIYGTSVNGTGTTVSTGNVGIGTATPGYKLDVKGDAAFGSGAERSLVIPAIPTLTGVDNAIAGSGAGAALTIGTENTAFGSLALGASTSGVDNTAIGYRALGSDPDGSYSTAVGSFALGSNFSDSNTAVGYAVLYSNTLGTQNTAVGSYALSANTTASNNTAVGDNALRISNGANNIALGYAAGNNITTGTNNIIIGYDIDAPSATGSNQMSIGNLIYGTSVNGTGTTVSTGNVGIGTATPTSTLHVVSTGSMAIPNAAAPTVDAAGEMAIDTTDDQLVYYGAAKRVVPVKHYKSATLENPADADNFNLFKAPYAMTITNINCIVDPADTGESAVIDVQERTSAGATPASVDAAITCTNTGAADDGVLTNGGIDSGDWVSLDIGTVTGTVTQVTVTITYTVDAT